MHCDTSGVLSVLWNMRPMLRLARNGDCAGKPISQFSYEPCRGSDLKGIRRILAGSGGVGAIVVDKLPLSSELRRLLHHREQMG